MKGTKIEFSTDDDDDDASTRQKKTLKKSIYRATNRTLMEK